MLSRSAISLTEGGLPMGNFLGEHRKSIAIKHRAQDVILCDFLSRALVDALQSGKKPALQETDAAQAPLKEGLNLDIFGERQRQHRFDCADGIKEVAVILLAGTVCTKMDEAHPADKRPVEGG